MHLSEIWHSKKNDSRLSRTQVINFVMVIPRLQINHTDGRLWKPV